MILDLAVLETRNTVAEKCQKIVFIDQKGMGSSLTRTDDVAVQ